MLESKRITRERIVRQTQLIEGISTLAKPEYLVHRHHETASLTAYETINTPDALRNACDRPCSSKREKKHG